MVKATPTKYDKTAEFGSVTKQLTPLQKLQPNLLVRKEKSVFTKKETSLNVVTSPTKKKEKAVVVESIPGTVETIVGNASAKGGVTQVRVKVMAGRDEGKIITRNVRGPVKVNDVLMMTETEYEARKIWKKTGGKK